MHPFGNQRRIRRQRLVMDAHKIEPFQELVRSIGKKLVAGIRGRTGTADQHLHAGLFARRLHSLGHMLVHVTVTRNVRAPPGDGDRLPGLIPQFHRIQIAFRPPVTRSDPLYPLLKIVVVGW